MLQTVVRKTSANAKGIQLKFRSIATNSNLQTKTRPPLAFVLDIDGVLLRGPTVIPAARRALSVLEGANPFKVRIPYLLLTNGGGVSEAERCRKLNKQLGFQIDLEQYIQAHTVLKDVVHKYADEPVLVLGGKLDTARRVAESYGFKQVFTTLDVLAWNPSVWPFHQLTEAERLSTKPIDSSTKPISAIFVFHDPRNWALDVQVVCDMIRSGGVIGGPVVDPSQGSKKLVDLVFCNPDLLWRSDFPVSRFGQGAFKEAFQGVYKALTGENYPYIQYGKPTRATSTYAEKVLSRYIKELSGVDGPLPHIYMIGDNPESDIAGANAARWSSILVETGVYDPRQGPPAHRPTHVAKDVDEAVSWAIRRETA